MNINIATLNAILIQINYLIKERIINPIIPNSTQYVILLIAVIKYLLTYNSLIPNAKI